MINQSDSLENKFPWWAKLSSWLIAGALYLIFGHYVEVFLYLTLHISLFTFHPIDAFIGMFIPFKPILVLLAGMLLSGQGSTDSYNFMLLAQILFIVLGIFLGARLVKMFNIKTVVGHIIFNLVFLYILTTLTFVIGGGY